MAGRAVTWIWSILSANVISVTLFSLKRPLERGIVHLCNLSGTLMACCKWPLFSLSRSQGTAAPRRPLAKILNLFQLDLVKGPCICCFWKDEHDMAKDVGTRHKKVKSKEKFWAISKSSYFLLCYLSVPSLTEMYYTNFESPFQGLSRKLCRIPICFFRIIMLHCKPGMEGLYLGHVWQALGAMPEVQWKYLTRTVLSIVVASKWTQKTQET